LTNVKKRRWTIVHYKNTLTGCEYLHDGGAVVLYILNKELFFLCERAKHQRYKDLTRGKFDELKKMVA